MGVGGKRGRVALDSIWGSIWPDEQAGVICKTILRVRVEIYYYEDTNTHLNITRIRGKNKKYER